MIRKTILALATMASMVFNASAQKPGEDNGLGIRLNVGFPGGNTTYRVTEDYLSLMYTIGNGTYKVEGTAFGLSLDNRWYVWNNNKMGAAIQGRWFDGNFISGKLCYDGIWNFLDFEDINMTQFSGGILGVGPMFTWYLGNDMAIDAYYNIMPAVCYTKIETSSFEYENGDTNKEIEKEKDIKFWGIGASHHVGAAFRWKMLQAGLEYRFGSINNMKEVDYDSFELDTSLKLFKINLGVKF